jgi:hypothetical protein
MKIALIEKNGMRERAQKMQVSPMPVTPGQRYAQAEKYSGRIRAEL